MTDENRQLILQAAVEAAALHGIRRLSVSDVAQRAGVSRPTLYKHFPSKDVLIAAAVAAEATRLVERVVAEAAAEVDPRRSLEAAILCTLRLARDHPLLDRLVRTEPESLLPLLTSDGGPAVPAVRLAAEALLADRAPDLGPVARRRVADALTRLLVSYAVSAPDDPPEVVASTLADLFSGALGESVSEPAAADEGDPR